MPSFYGDLVPPPATYAISEYQNQLAYLILAGKAHPTSIETQVDVDNVPRVRVEFILPPYHPDELPDAQTVLRNLIATEADLRNRLTPHGQLPLGPASRNIIRD